MAHGETNGVCCGVMDISDLHIWKRPETALKQILKSTETVAFGVYVAPSGRWTPGKGYEKPGGYTKLDSPKITPLKNAYGMFSGVQKEQYAQRFASFLKREKLGRVVKAHAAYNPNHPERVGKTGGKLLVYLWTIDHQALEQWIQKNIKTEADLAYTSEDQVRRGWDWQGAQPQPIELDEDYDPQDEDY
jgi:hypothetical protein